MTDGVGEAARMRPARADEAALLSRLAISSKAHWGYDEAFLDACRGELTLAGDDIERHTVVVAEDRGTVSGFYVLCPAGDAAESGSSPRGVLEHLYVDPGAIGNGTGRRLWRHMIAAACRHGYKQVVIHSDPHAEGFYRAMGAHRVGDVASGSIEGRRLPLMSFDVIEGEKGP